VVISFISWWSHGLESLKIVSNFSGHGKTLNTEYGLESFGICFERSLKVLDL